MARTKFVLCSAPHGGRYARIDEKTGQLLADIEKARRVSPTMSKVANYMPIYVSETMLQVKNLYKKGVRFFHDHSFDKSGIHATSSVFYERLETELRKIDPQLIHSVASSNRRGASIIVVHKIVQALKRKNLSIADINPFDPEHIDIFVRGNLERFKGAYTFSPPDTITTITNLEYAISLKIKPGRELAHLFSATHPELIKGYYNANTSKLKFTDVNHEIEISTMDAFPIIEIYFEKVVKNRIGNPIHFVILFNFTNGLRLSEQNVKKVLSYIEGFKVRNKRHKVAVSFGLVIVPKMAATAKRKKGDVLPQIQGKYTELDYRELIELTLKYDNNNLVGAFRVGTEDTSTMYGSQRDDLFFIDEVLEVFKEYGLSVITDSLKAREVFNLPPREGGGFRRKIFNPFNPFNPKSMYRKYFKKSAEEDIIKKTAEITDAGYGQIIDALPDSELRYGDEGFEDRIEKIQEALEKAIENEGKIILSKNTSFSK